MFRSPAWLKDGMSRLSFPGLSDYGISSVSFSCLSEDGISSVSFPVWSEDGLSTVSSPCMSGDETSLSFFSSVIPSVSNLGMSPIKFISSGKSH